jgi:hypothetical protein
VRGEGCETERKEKKIFVLLRQRGRPRSYGGEKRKTTLFFFFDGMSLARVGYSFRLSQVERTAEACCPRCSPTTLSPPSEKKSPPRGRPRTRGSVSFPPHRSLLSPRGSLISSLHLPFSTGAPSCTQKSRKIDKNTLYRSTRPSPTLAIPLFSVYSSLAGLSAVVYLLYFLNHGSLIPVL